MTKDEINKKRKEKYWQNPEKYRAISRKNLTKNREKINNRKRELYHQQIEKMRQKDRDRQPQVNERCKKRRKTDYMYVIKRRLNASLNQALRFAKTRKSTSTFDLIGCSPQELIKYLESKFTDNMSWDNRNQWHIDHIVPCSMFDLTDPEQQKVCFHFTNLQPLWAKDNLSKNSKVLPTAIRLLKLNNMEIQ